MTPVDVSTRDDSPVTFSYLWHDFKYIQSNILNILVFFFSSFSLLCVCVYSPTVHLHRESSVVQLELEFAV